MKAHLLHRDKDLDLGQPLLWNAEALVKDLGLDILFYAMGQEDEFVRDMAKRVVLSGEYNDIETIRYRQGVLQDCLRYPNVIRDIYLLAAEAEGHRTKQFYGSTLMRYPDWALRRSIELSEAFLGTIGKLRMIADSHADKFVSAGWTAFFSTLHQELNDEYLARAHDHVAKLKFADGMLLSAGLGNGNKGAHYFLRRQYEQPRRGWLARLFSRRPSAMGFSIHPRDESGARALRELGNRGIGGVASALTQSADHMRSFIGALRSELAFYVGCVNLHEQLTGKGEPSCFPLPMEADERRLSFRGLYDVALALGVDRRVVGNEANADRKDLVIVTGANQGGKSTFLRGIGLAQLMMRCGMFVAADSFVSSVYDGVFTHYKREEDTGMKSGKLDEELDRMSDIVDHITPHSIILFNESFASTNEREGSEIARQILLALSESGIKVVCVTHLHELAKRLVDRDPGNILFLRAERKEDGVRTFKIVEGEPLQTSFGEDLYESIFGVEDDRCDTNGSATCGGAR
jgi:hypothetical protein